MKELIKALKKEDIVKTGSFILTSGKSSDYYFDVKKAIGNPELLEMMSSLLAEGIRGKATREHRERSRNPTEQWPHGHRRMTATCIASIGFGGIPLATAVSLKLKLPLVMVRNSAKGHGLGKIIEGYVPSSKDKVAVVDDVFSFGTSLEQILKQINKTSAKILGCHVVITCSDKKTHAGIPIYHLIKAEEIED